MCSLWWWCVGNVKSVAVCVGNVKSGGVCR